jgi:hypothetical protein
MELNTSRVLLGIHVVIAAAFLLFAVQGVVAGADPVAIGLRVLLAVLVVGLGVSVTRLS